MAAPGHKTYKVIKELKKQREALENKKSAIQEKIYNQNKIINLGIKHSFKNKIKNFVKNITIYAKDDPAKEGANAVEQLREAIPRKNLLPFGIFPNSLDPPPLYFWNALRNFF